jgi:hypothetical protein
MRAVKKGFLRARRVVSLLAVVSVVSFVTTVPTPAQAITCTSTPAGLIARWPGDGSPVDVAHGRDGTLVGGTTYAAGEVDQGFSFDGVDDVVSVPDDPDWSLAGDFTIDTWVKIAALHGVSEAFVAQDEGVGLTNKWVFWYGEAGDLGFVFGTGGAGYHPVSASWNPTLSQWYHVAVTRSASDYTLYIDGSVVDTGTESTPIPDAATSLTLGWGETDWHLDGALDETEIYQRALSGAEINAIYTAGSNTRCAVGTSSITLNPVPSTTAPGSTVHLTGALTMSSGTLEGTPIHLFRSVNGGAETSIGAPLASPNGAFSLDDAPPNGEVTYRAAFDGAPNLPAANVWASTSVKQKQSSVTIAVSDASITFGQSIKVKAHLHGGETNRSLSIFSTPAGGHKQLLKKGTVNEDGVLIVTAKPSRNTSYLAKYMGDAAWNGDTSGSVGVTVAVRWSGKAVGGYATSNGFRLYHYNSSCSSSTSKLCPAATFTLSPNHAGQRVYFIGKYCKAGRCYGDTGRYRLNKRSQVTVHIRYGSSQAIGFVLYLRFRFGGDSDHKGATANVIKEKITA